MQETFWEGLNLLQREIEAGDFMKKAQTVSDWGGADVMISSHLTPHMRRWLGDNHLVLTLQQSQPKRRAVITPYSKELSWLFYRLRDIFSETLDFTSKYDFFGRLAQSAIDYIRDNKEHSDCTGLLKTVLKEARRMVQR